MTQPVEFLNTHMPLLTARSCLTLDGKEVYGESKQGGQEMENKSRKFAVLKGMGLRGWLSGEESASHCSLKHGFDPWPGKIPCLRVFKPVHRSTTLLVFLEPVSRNYEACMPLEPMLHKRKPLQWEACAGLQWETRHSWNAGAGAGTQHNRKDGHCYIWNA